MGSSRKTSDLGRAARRQAAWAAVKHNNLPPKIVLHRPGSNKK